MFHSSIILEETSYAELRKRISVIMGQFIEFISSIFTSKKDPEIKDTSHHVKFSDSSFSQAFSSSNNDRVSKLDSLRQANRSTIRTYQFIVLVACMVHFYLVTWPKTQLENFDFLQPDGWQMLTLSLVPVVVQIACLGAMIELNKGIPDGTKLSNKNLGLELDKNNYIQSLKVVIVLIVLCQALSAFIDHILWSIIVIVSLWSIRLTTKLAQTEYDRHAPSPKKQWVKLNIKSPKTPSTPAKQSASQPSSATKKTDAQNKATPRTRTRRAVKNLITGVSDKYHAFEQNVAHQISQKIFSPMNSRAKAIEPQ